MPLPEIPEALSSLIAASRSARIIELPLASLQLSVGSELVGQLAKAHRLDGAALEHAGIAVLGFRLPQEARLFLNLTDEGVRFFPYGWCLDFGAALTVSVTYFPARQNPGFIQRVFLSSHSPALPLMAGGKFRCVFFNADVPVRFYEVNFGDRLKIEVENVLTHKAKLYQSDGALFWQIVEALQSTPGLREYLLREERLSIGWQTNYRRAVQIYFKERDDILSECDFSEYNKSDLPLIVTEFLDTCLQSRFDCEIVAKFANSIFESLDKFIKFATAGDSNNVNTKIPAASIASITRLAIRLGLRTPQITACGRRVIWVRGSVGNGFGFFIPDAANFPKSFDPEEYWKRIPYDLPHWALGALVEQSDVPVSLPSESLQWHLFPKTKLEDRSKTIEVADTLMDEAAANKRWVIPSRALVQVPAGPFTHFEVSEFGKQVFFVGRTERGEFAILTFEIENKAFSFPELNWLGHFERELYDSIYSALKLLLAAVIRDFWVVEVRDSVFASGKPRRLGGLRVRTSNDGSQRVVYLPRIHYREGPNPQKCAEALDHKTRSGHYVQQHVRKVGRPSDAQIILAKQYGFNVPEGYTFVRPHERGMGAVSAVIYRSRSALQSLYRIDQTLPPGTASWFRFEKDVERLLGKLGFKVEHRAASRNGDQGVDLYATKGVDLDAINWIIQCKCYHLNHSIGPDKLRELHGVVMTHPPGTRGMIVTTSVFTSGARALAGELNIRLMDGAEFAQRIK